MTAAVPAGHRDPTQAWGAVGHLRLTVQSTLLSPMKHDPSCEIDGESVPIRNGENLILVHAGRHHVEAHVLWTGPFGRASADVEVPPDGEAALWYAPSFYRFVEGRLGPAPQQAAGAWFIVLVFLVLAVGLLLTWIR